MSNRTLPVTARAVTSPQPLHEISTAAGSQDALSPSDATASLSPGPLSKRGIPRHPKRRMLNKFACHGCQKKKTKCDGVRPICSACIRRKDRNCEYPVKEGAVSRLSDLRQNFEELERENHDFKDLFAYIRQKPENEAFELYRRLRMSEDPLKTLRQFRDAETLLALPTYATPSCTAEKFMHEIEADALAKSPLRVPARPWTSVAGDGLVSSLISSFFKWDDCIMYPFVDRDLFLRDMRNSEPSSSQYCSSLLVNIICATRSLMSDRVKFVRMTTGHDPGAAFLMEAKKHVDEELNKMCLTTVQGVYMLAVYCCCEGNSRAGSMYRFAALQMLRKMKPGALHAMLNANIPKEAELQRAFSKLCWGIFVFELMLAESSLSAPEMGPPPVPIIYDEESLMNHNLDVTGRSFITGSPEPPTAPGVFPAACEAARLYYDIQIYNQRPHGRVGCDPDMFQRHEIFKKLSNLELALPPRLDYRRNRAPGTMFLKLFLNMIALSILRPLPPSTPFQHDPSNPSRPCTTAKSLMIRLCAVDIEIVESYIRTYGLQEYSAMIVTGIYGPTSMLLSMLPGRKPNLVDFDEDSSLTSIVPDLFTRACTIMRAVEKDLPSMRLTMQGLLVVAKKTQRVIPAAARPLFEGLGRDRAKMKDLPVDMVLPVLEDLKLILGGGETHPGEWGEGVGAIADLLKSWEELALD